MVDSCRPLRIAFISGHASPLAAPGGVDSGSQGVYADKVARCLAATGHHVDVMTRRSSPDQPGVVDIAPGLRLFHVDAGPACFVAEEAMLDHMPAFAAWLLRHMLSVPRYDVIHANFFMSGWAGLQLGERLGLPLVVTFHALGLVRREHHGRDDGFPAERIDIERQLVRSADRIVAECPQDEADLIRLYAAPRRHIRTVPCGVDLREFAICDRGASRRLLGIADDEFVVLQLGRIVRREGIDNVIRAVSLLKNRGRVRLLVVGGDADPAMAGTASTAPEAARLAQLAADCGIADRVTFLGHRQRHQLAACYAACDVFATTPWSGPFGIAPLEAMAASRPVVGSAIGSIRHTVVDGTTGFLVPPGDPAALADRLERLRSAPLLAQTMGFAGRHRVMACFTWERVAADLARVYDEVVERRSLSRLAPPGEQRGAARTTHAVASA